MRFNRNKYLFLVFYFIYQVSFSQTIRPPDISGLQLWLKADSAATVHLNGTSVMQWDDCSGNNNNVTQSTASMQPTFIGNISSLNNKAAIGFNGVNNVLDGFDFYSALNNKNTYTIFCVITGNWSFGNDNDFQGCKGIIGAPENGGGYFAGVGIGTNSFVTGLYDGTHEQTTLLADTGKTKILLVVNNNGSLKICDEKNSCSTAISVGNVSANASTIGIGHGSSSTTYFDGDIAEIIIYNSVLTSTELQQIEYYLEKKYAHQVNLGSDINIPYGFCDTTLDAGAGFSSYLWSTGQTTQTIHVDSAGMYSVAAPAFFGFSSSDTITVSYPKINLHDTTFCPGSYTTLSTGLNGSYTYNWTGGLTTPTINVSSPGIYAVTVTDANHCSKASNVITVSKDTFASTVSLGPDTNMCSGNTIGLRSPSPLPTGLTYLWSNAATTSTIVVTATGYYSLTVTNKKGCSAVDSIHVNIVGSAPVANFTDITACSEDTANFTNTSLPLGTSWFWDFGDGQTSTIENPKHVFINGGNYFITLKVYDGSCSNSIFKNIHIPYSPIASFTVDTACTANNYTFTDQSTSAEGNIISWYWDFGNSYHSYAKDTTYAYPAAGNFMVTLTVQTDSGCTAKVTHQITVVSTAPSPLPFTLYLPSNGFITSDNTISFAWSPASGAISYTLEYSPDPLFTYNVISIQNLSVSSFQQNISISQKYYWRVIAYGLCGNSITSNIFSFTIFSPTTIPSIALWLKADSNIVLNSGNVAQWNDCSGKNNNVNQTTSNLQPLLVNNILNSKPIVRFNGDWMAGTFASILAQPNTIFVVFTNRSSSQQEVYSGVDVNQRHQLDINGSGVNDITAMAGAWSCFYTGNSAPYTIINTCIFNGASSKMFENGILKATGDVGSQSMSGITLGALYNGALTFNGDIAEIIIYNKALINNERILIEKYLTKKYFPDQYHPIRYVNLGPDIWANNFCDTTINAGNFFAHYHWSTGDSTSSIKVNTAGTYWVTAIDSSGFTSSDTIIVHKPTITAHDTLACIGSNVTLYTGLKTPYTFHWQPGGSTADSLVVTAPSTNTLTITDTLGCSTIKIIKVSADSFAAKVSLGTPPITKCSGDTVYLVKGAGAAASYDWWDGTAHSYGTSYPIAWLTGTHPLLLTVKDTMGCVANISTNIHIQGAQPIVGFTYTPVCYPGSTFTVFKDTSSAVAGSSLSSWQWDFGNGDIAVYLGSSAFTYPYDSAAIYNVKLTVTTITGCSKSVTEHVPVYSVPVPAFQPHIGCSGVPMKMKDRSTSLLGDVNTWNWNISDPFSTQNTSSDTNIIHTFNNTGYYKVKLVVTTVPGCKDSITDSISIRYAPKVGFSYTNVCFGNPVYFNDTTQTQPWASITYWYWNFGNGQTSSIQNPVCIFGNAGTFPVSLTINTINGCVVTDTTPVVVHAIPEAIFTTTDVCAKNPYIFHDSSKVALPDTISSWLWTFGNVTTSNSKNPAITFPASGTFTVSLDVSSNAGCKDSTKHTVHVDPIPTAAFTPDSYFGVAPFTVTFDNTSQGAANYLWNFGDTLGTSTQTDPNYLYTKNGIYTVSLIAYNQYGCKDSTTQKMMVIPTIADIAVSNVKLTKPSQGNYDTLSADITNLGTRWISEINLYANAADGTSFMETWSNSLHPLEPGATMTYVFNAKYKLSDDQSASYFCVDAEIADKNTTDDNPKNNEQCITYSNSFTALAPYPSPTHDQVYIDFILPPSYNAAKESDNVTIELFGIKGDKVRTILSGKAEKGLNRLTVDVSSLNIGVYTYRIMFRENINIFRFVKY